VADPEEEEARRALLPAQRMAGAQGTRVYLLYWYKSTNTDEWLGLKDFSKYKDKYEACKVSERVPEFKLKKLGLSPPVLS
jgi:hypothetical protein